MKTKKSIPLTGDKSADTILKDRRGKCTISIKVSARVADIWRKWRKTYSSSATRVSDSAILAATVMPHEEMMRIWELLDSGDELTREALVQARDDARVEREKFLAELRGEKPTTPKAVTPVELEPITFKLLPGGITFDDGSRGEGISLDDSKWTFRTAVIDPLKTRTPEKLEHCLLELIDHMERTTAKKLNLPEPPTNPRLIVLDALQDGVA